MKTKVISLIILALVSISWAETYAQTENIGIGTSSPDNSSILDITSISRGLLLPRMSLDQRDLIISPASGLLIYQTDNIPGLYYNSGTSSDPYWKMVGSNAGQWQDNGTSIYYNGGNVGIGKNNPSNTFEVKNLTFDGRAIVGEAAAENSIAIWGIGLQANSIGIVGEGTNFGVFGATATTTGTAVKGDAVAVTGINYGVFGNSGSAAGYGVYGTSPKYGIYGYASGNVGRAVVGEAVGTSSIALRGIALASNSTGVYSEGTNYDFYAAGPGTDYGSSSSKRWKINITVIPDALNKVSSLRGVYFDWDAEHGRHHDVGMIAEEVGVILPEIVTYEDNGVDAVGMDYGRLTPLLVEAIKELSAKVEALEKELNELKGERDFIGARDIN